MNEDNRAKIAAIIARLSGPQKPQSPAPITSATIQLDPLQSKFCDLAQTLPKAAVLVGAAGTGKTTCMREVTERLIRNPAIPLMNTSHKYLPMGVPGIVIVAYTNRAANNIRKKLPLELQANCITIHKLLEYQPVFEEYVREDGSIGTYRRFEPARTALNPLSSQIRCIIWEESSQVGLDLYNQVIDAFPRDKPAMIFLGDINQIQPVFGPAILGYKMLEALSQDTLVELTTIHRQALASPIISLAHKMLHGDIREPISEISVTDAGEHGKVTLHPLKKRTSPETYIHVLGTQLFQKHFESGLYKPLEDMILIPFNKQAGTLALNKYIASFYAKARAEPVYEVISGWQTQYFSVGDKLVCGKVDCIITAIKENPLYQGKTPRIASTELDYWGNHKGESAADTTLLDGAPEEDFDTSPYNFSTESEDDTDITHQASHIIQLQSLDNPDLTFTLKTAGDINNLLFGYAITIHKAQGSEARKVYVCLHRNHASMLSRELVYTAFTRAKEELYVVCEKDSLVTSAARQQVAGADIYQKAALFKGKILNGLAPSW